jgi:hypothetical protein
MAQTMAQTTAQTIAPPKASIDGHAIHRSLDDEQEDFNESIQNWVSGAYHEWPNEAAVSRPPTTHEFILSTYIPNPF